MKKFILLLFILAFTGCTDYKDLEDIEGFSQTCIDYAIPNVSYTLVTNEGIIAILIKLEACKTRELLTILHKENK